MKRKRRYEKGGIKKKERKKEVKIKRKGRRVKERKVTEDKERL